jgi:hypothetical protein
VAAAGSGDAAGPGGASAEEQADDRAASRTRTRRMATTIIRT